MAEVQITLKLSASEYQTLREELAEVRSHLNTNYRAARNPKEKENLRERAARVTFLLEKLG